MPDQTPAQAAYAAYGAATGGLTHDNRPMPAWEQLGPRIQVAWAAAAGAVLAEAEQQTADRLAAIAQLASALQDYLPGDAWHLAHAIEQCARGQITAAEALADPS